MGENMESSAPSPAHAITIEPVLRPFDAVVRVPGSKSITNRALPIAAMADGVSTLHGVLFSDDTRRMIESLQRLGFQLHVEEPARRIQVVGGSGRIPAVESSLFCGNSGTTMRFLTAFCAASSGRHCLHGVPRMHQRPIGELITALAMLGGRLDYKDAPGFPPVCTTGTGLAGGICRFSATQSSQYISAVLLASPLARQAVRIRLDGPVTSEPYVEMTLNMMDQFGIAFKQETTATGREITIASGQHYRHRTYAIEPDASNASYFLAAAALIPQARVRILGLGNKSLQGDVAFAEVLKQVGAAVEILDDQIVLRGTGQITGIDINMNNIPDMVQTLAVVALFARGPTRITGVGNLRLKETDRLAALQTELTRLGAQVRTTAESITIEPPEIVHPARIHTYDDHRMAMAFAVAGLRQSGIQIADPDCCAKTYPDFFRDLAAMAAVG